MYLTVSSWSGCHSIAEAVAFFRAVSRASDTLLAEDGETLQKPYNETCVFTIHNMQAYLLLVSLQVD